MRERALVVANDHVGSAMAGPGIRSYRFAIELASTFDVTLVVPFATDLVDERIDIVHDNPWDPARMSRLVAGYDLVVAQRLPVPTMRKLARSETRAIYDLYAPLTLEQLALDSREAPTPYREAMARLNTLTQDVALETGNAFVCASERQRDFWLGALAAVGRLDHALYERDPSLRSLIDVVPFGLDPERPSPGRALRGAVTGIAESDRILLWPGGIWNWFDPLTVIRAVHEISRRRDDVRLYFLGVRHPNPEVPEMSMAAEAIALAEELRLRDRVVFFNPGWVPYAERGGYLLDADLAVSAHFDDVETRFAFRTRLLDCIWAGLPVVTTEGDTLGDLIAECGGGRALPPRDVAAWAATLELLLDDEDLRAASAHAIATLRQELEWPRTLAPLRRLAAPDTELPTPPRRRNGGTDYMRLRLQVGYERHGLGGAARRLGTRIAAAVRRRS